MKSIIFARVSTNEYNKVLDLIYQQTNELRVGKKENGESFSTFSVSVPGAGIEPARIAPLVFETSASTDSAIRAGVNASTKWCSMLIMVIHINRTAKIL